MASYQDYVQAINACTGREALALALECCHKYNNTSGFSLEAIVDSCAFTRGDVRAMRDDFVLGLYYIKKRQHQRAYAFMLRVGTVVANCYVGELLCMRGNYIEGRRILEQAMVAGCAAAKPIYDIYRDVHKPMWLDALRTSHLVTATKHLGIRVQWCASVLTTPFGLWLPVRTYHRIVAPCIHRTIMTFLLVAKRLGIDRNVTLIICSFIVTRGPWYLLT